MPGAFTEQAEPTQTDSVPSPLADFPFPLLVTLDTWDRCDET